MQFGICTGTVGPDQLNQSIDSNSLRIVPNIKLQSNYLTTTTNATLTNKITKKKGKIRFKCLHCDYLTFKKQNLVVHLRQKHEVI